MAASSAGTATTPFTTAISRPASDTDVQPAGARRRSVWGEGFSLGGDFFIADFSGRSGPLTLPSPPSRGRGAKKYGGGLRWWALSAVADVGDGAEGEGRVVLQHFVGIDAVLVAPRAQRPFDLVVIAPGADL